MFPAAPLHLADLGPDDRLTLLEATLRALQRFEKRAGEPVPVPADLAERLRSGPAQDPLVLAMAALVAYERRGFSPGFDLDRLDLAREVAEHEERRINGLAKAAGRDSHLLRHMVAFITLTGSLSTAELEEACEAERTHVAPRSSWAEDLYTVLTTQALPPEQPLPPKKATFAVDPVLPDIVGEALIFSVLRGREHKAEETVVRASRIKPGEVTRSLRRIIQDFASASPGEGKADGSEQDRALNLLSNVLRARSRALRDEDFWAIHAELPLDSLAMSGAALGFYQAVVESRPDELRAEGADPVFIRGSENLRSACAKRQVVPEYPSSEPARRLLQCIVDLRATSVPGSPKDYTARVARSAPSSSTRSGRRPTTLSISA